MAGTIVCALYLGLALSRELRPRYPSSFPKGPFVLEYTAVSKLVAEWSQGSGELDPFGVVLWPAADTLAQLVGAAGVEGLSTLELGCGTGLCSLVAADRGAARALATDANPAPLELVVSAAAQQDLRAVETMVFDMGSSAELPADIDLLLAADVCYSAKIARALAARCAQAHARGVHCMLADSVNIARSDLIGELGRLGVAFEQEILQRSFSGHAVSLDQEVERTCSVAVFRI
jgi:predicted nicotinamide N-methyase